jgi:photosynthetic reaction center cytochrome c subunit
MAVCLSGLSLFGQTGSAYKNLDILKGVPDERIPAVMQAFTGFLGVGCTHCHVEGKWESAGKAPFTRTRQMFRMRAALNSGPLKDYAGIGCWTCHRGQPKPEPVNPRDLQDPSWPADVALQAGQETQPAEKVFANIQTFTGVPAGRFPTVMKLFTVSLGVTCTHCHVAGDWKSDAKTPKQTARVMMRMVRSTKPEYFDQASAGISCWTCHRGSLNPERNAPPKA